MTPSPSRIWIVPVNDGEAVEIRNLLRRQGERVFTTAQPWGASWAGLEPELATSIETALGADPSLGVIGVELAGPTRWGGRNVDHHFYKGDDRRHPLSSLEQVAVLLDTTLTRHQRLVAVNDAGWIPGLISFGATPSEIEIVRAQDRCAQGVTPDQEAQAVRDLALAERRGRNVLVNCPTGATSAHSDRLWGSFTDANGSYDELLTAGPRVWIYYGPRAGDLVALALPEQHWSGGQAPRCYFGVTTPSPETQERILSLFWA
jgi:hypothetical protein